MGTVKGKQKHGTLEQPRRRILGCVRAIHNHPSGSKNEWIEQQSTVKERRRSKEVSRVPGFSSLRSALSWPKSFHLCMAEMENEEEAQKKAEEEEQALDLERLCQIVHQRDKVAKMALANLNDKLSVLEQQMVFLETHVTAVTHGEEATRSQ